MKPRPKQIEKAEKAYAILEEYGLVYLAMEERCGKSLTAILTAEKMPTRNKGLIVTKVKALEGWEQTLKEFEHKKQYDLINYHKLKNIKGKYDFAILDESHAYISAAPIRSGMWKLLFAIVYGIPIIYMSATPHAQGYHLLINQLALSKWSPFKKFKDYYEWYKEYADRDKNGDFKMVVINAYQKAINYKAVQGDRIARETKHLFVTGTRAEMGFEQEPEDVEHWIKLSDSTKAAYNLIVEKRVLNFTSKETGKSYKLIADSPAKFRYALHMLEGGTLKIDDEYVILGNREKIDWILEKFGDTEDLVIMYQYKGEKIKLERVFKKALIRQGDAFAEGVDFSKHKHLVIYSQSFSTAKHSQRRARQANQNRKDEILVHFPLVKGAASAHVYKEVSKNKRDFVDTVFERI